MSQDRSSRPGSKRSGVNREEEKAWVSFYRRVGNPAIATEVLHQLESEPELKRAHLALYLRCKESLRVEKARLARHKRIGQLVRTLSRTLIVAPIIAIRSLLRQTSEIAYACLPEVQSKQLTRGVRSLTRDPEFAQAQPEFGRPSAIQAAKQAGAEVGSPFPPAKAA